MKTTIQRITCEESGCGAELEIKITGTHDCRSTSFELAMLAYHCSWNDGRCPDHRRGLPKRPEG